MSDIPVTAKEFHDWSFPQLDTWPAELCDKAQRALLVLKAIDMNPPWVINAMSEFTPNTWAGWLRDLLTFAEAYGAWRAREHG